MSWRVLASGRPPPPYPEPAFQEAPTPSCPGRCPGRKERGLGSCPPGRSPQVPGRSHFLASFTLPHHRLGPVSLPVSWMLLILHTVPSKAPPGSPTGVLSLAPIFPMIWAPFLASSPWLPSPLHLWSCPPSLPLPFFAPVLQAEPSQPPSESSPTCWAEKER